ncbi:MAG: penicillin-binding protein 2 [Candidatus Nealsonbacteria bacterium]|nr:penicillin-binding protein 2 [Candidatus Nealsonbacteria bacterium]
MLEFLSFKKFKRRRVLRPSSQIRDERRKTFLRTLLHIRFHKWKLGNRRIQLAFKEDIEPHEILLDSLAEKKEKELGLSEKKFEVPLLKRIIQSFFIFCFFIILFLFFKTFQLQVVEGKNFIQLAERNKFIIHHIQAERGVIYDKNLEQLVFNKSTFDLICEKSKIPQDEAEKERILQQVSKFLEKDVKELKKEIDESESDQVLIAKNLSHQELILFETRIDEFLGFQIKNNVIREYRDGEVFSQIIGYTGKIKSEEFEAAPEFYLINDYVGRTGVENFYERFLRKNPGKLRIERDVFENVISKEVVSLPESGKSLVLWLDADLQRKTEEELEKKYKEIGAKGAIAIAMDPKTGGILSLVSLPSFDNNLFQKGADQKSLQALLEDSQNLNSLFDRAISGRYLTGSTIKPLIASAALEEKIINPDEKINCQGLIEVEHTYTSETTEFLDWTVHGWTDLRKAIAESCNVYFYTVGGGYKEQEGLGPTKIKEYLELFGWGEKTGIDLPGEINGFIPDKEWKKRVLGEGWWDGNTYNLSIGQEYLQITPLEVVTSFSAIANGGKLLQPQVVKEIITTSGTSTEVSVVEEDLSSSSPFAAARVVKEFEPEIIRENFIDPGNLQIVREGMRQAVTGQNSPLASSVILNSLPIAVAAKTGTAELGGDRYHNWVTVFAPYEDPEIVLTVMIEDVKGVQAAVLPVAKAILEWYFTK